MLLATQTARHDDNVEQSVQRKSAGEGEVKRLSRREGVVQRGRSFDECRGNDARERGRKWTRRTAMQ